MNEKKAVELLKDAKKSFDRHNVVFWLRDGTILGAVRDKKFISWDTDIDIGVWGKDFKNLYLVEKDMKEIGYKTAIHPDDTPPSLNIVKDDCNMDIAAYSSKDGKISVPYIEPNGLFGQSLNYLIWILNLRVEPKEGRISDDTTKNLIKFCKLIPKHTRQNFVLFFNKIYMDIATSHFIKVIPSHYYENLVKIKLYNILVNIPYSTEEYLIYRYGKDWKTPRQQNRGVTGLQKGFALKKEGRV